MDSYEWEDDRLGRMRAIRATIGPLVENYGPGGWIFWAGAEIAEVILCLAERVRDLEASYDEALQQLEEQLQDREEAFNAAKLTAEEGSEIIGELSAALAVLAGEDLKPCLPPCAGHLREKANAAVKGALEAWHALKDEGRRLQGQSRDINCLKDAIRLALKHQELGHLEAALTATAGSDTRPDESPGDPPCSGLGTSGE